MEPPGREAREMQERGQRDARGGDKRERLERFYFKKKEMGEEADEAQGSAIRIFCGRDL